MNIRGVNKSPKQASVQALIVKHSLSFVGLIETRVKSTKAIAISKSICNRWE